MINHGTVVLSVQFEFFYLFIVDKKKEYSTSVFQVSLNLLPSYKPRFVRELIAQTSKTARDLGTYFVL